MTNRHPEVPDDADRDHSLLITEAQQRELLEFFTTTEFELREVTLQALAETPIGRDVAEQHLAGLTELTRQACDVIANAVTVEERIAHLDFVPGDPD
ncbi:hypothetical protein [Saccharopolyspora sp. ASAGF58]|uniref:hypothetical protein n=1 Tax=Saccharopolyspora sp. ASAGF58 TaxID=2719023 RepID=UPI00143FE783|nr:hypothetical protein [Saccharopolyspora sp. ASAGF58]QIZ36287.1 hypothetical protein FDZ84_18410 [Saccharopolyspora sp. ASAGF58]